MNPLISIIIPVYNTENYLEECLESILAQTWSPLEVVLVDDGSTDRSRNILQSYAQQYSNFVAVYQNNKGVSKARNTGLQKAKGEYIAFCDSDDIIAPQMLELLFSNLRRTEADISCCGLSRFIVSEKPIFQIEQRIDILEGDDMYTAVIRDPNCAGYSFNKLFRRSILNQMSPICFPTDIAILEDEVFVLEVLNHCRKMCITNALLYGYRDHPNSARNQRLSEKKLTCILGRERILEIIKDSMQSQELISTAWNELMRTYAITYKKLLHTKVENGSFWRSRIKEGFRKQKGQGILDSSWSVKERLYYLLLCIVSY